MKPDTDVYRIDLICHFYSPEAGSTTTHQKGIDRRTYLGLKLAQSVCDKLNKTVDSGRYVPAKIEK